MLTTQLKTHAHTHVRIHKENKENTISVKNKNLKAKFHLNQHTVAKMLIVSQKYHYSAFVTLALQAYKDTETKLIMHQRSNKINVDC